MEAINQQSPSSPYLYKNIIVYRGGSKDTSQDLLEQHRILMTPHQTGRGHHRCPEAVSTLHCIQDQRCHPQKDYQPQDIQPDP